jgi:hypothetical protein
MPRPKPRPTPPDAEQFAAIAAECARICGVDVRLTPLASVPVQVGPAPGREVVGLGVRFDDEYVLVRLPNGSFRAFKVDASGRVELRLGVRGGYRTHVSRVFGALLWDRLKRGRSRYEPQLELLPVAPAFPLAAEAAQLEEAGPESGPRKPAGSPRQKNQSPVPPERSPSPAPPESPAAFGVEPAVSSAPPAREAASPEPPPPSSSEPSARPPAADAPLARRLRGGRGQ